MTMSLIILAVCLFLSAAFSGSETGLYSLSRARVEVRARAQRFGARWVQHALEYDSAILITILIGNNLTLEAATHQAEALTAMFGIGERWRELVITLTLTPVVVFFSELLPKELFRRRPYSLLGTTAAFIVLSRYVLWPVERVLSLVSWLLERLLKIEPRALVRLRGREAVLTLLAEGERGGKIAPRSSELMANALKLRTTQVAEVMVPWERVDTISADLEDTELRAKVGASRHTRLPLEAADGRVERYLHQLEILAREPDEPMDAHKLLVLTPETSVDRALARMRSAGHRCALVGSTTAPQGLLTLKDLVEEISGELAGW